MSAARWLTSFCATSVSSVGLEAVARTEGAVERKVERMTVDLSLMKSSLESSNLPNRVALVAVRCDGVPD